MAYEFLKDCSTGCSTEGVAVEEACNEMHGHQLPPRPFRVPQIWILRVNDVYNTRRDISRTFKAPDNRPLDDLIWDLWSGNVDPCSHRNMCLEVVQYRGSYYSNNNRRLYCLKQYQDMCEESGWHGWQVWGGSKGFSFQESPGHQVLERFLEAGEKLDENEIRIRGRPNHK